MAYTGPKLLTRKMYRSRGQKLWPKFRSRKVVIYNVYTLGPVIWFDWLLGNILAQQVFQFLKIKWWKSQWTKYIFTLHSEILFFFRSWPPLGFYIQSFSLTECIVIVGVRKYLGCLSVCLCVCLCVCVSVCLSVYTRTPKLLGRFPWNFPKMISHMSSCVRLSFGSLT